MQAVVQATYASLAFEFRAIDDPSGHTRGKLVIAV